MEQVRASMRTSSRYYAAEIPVIMVTGKNHGSFLLDRAVLRVLNAVLEDGMSRAEFPPDQFDSEESRRAIINMHSLIKGDMPASRKASLILESAMNEINILQKDALDRFVEYAFFKAKTGYPYIINMAYPTKRIAEKDIEKNIIELLNIHLMPDIIFRILKFFARNARNSDTNLYLAQLIESEDMIRSIYDTFVLFRSDIAKLTADERAVNVKQIQQYISVSEDRFSSPLDAACRMKYILEFLAIKQNVAHIYTRKDLMMAPQE
jgi:hypothetical protein